MLLGVTGSGKTFTVANVIRHANRPTLVIPHNKTLAAQLYAEFKGFFPNNAVEYFVSYFDFYQPEAYIPRTDTFIEKDSSINENIERLRLSTMSSLLSRRDVIVVASVSCIYGIGSKEDYEALLLPIHAGMALNRETFLSRLVDMQYGRNDIAFERGEFRVPWRHGGTASGLDRGRGARRVFWRRNRSHHPVRPAYGRRDRGAEVADHFSRQTIRHAPEQVEAGDLLDSRGTGQSRGLVREAGESCSKPSESRCGRSTTSSNWRSWGFCSGIENYSRHIAG